MNERMKRKLPTVVVVFTYQSTSDRGSKTGDPHFEAMPRQVCARAILTGRRYNKSLDSLPDTSYKNGFQRRLPIRFVRILCVGTLERTIKMIR